MFNNPKYKNLINDIAGVLREHNEQHYKNLLPEAVCELVEACAEEISEMDLGFRTAENIGKVMKNYFYEGTRRARIEPTHEMSAEFYNRVYNILSELKMPKKDASGRAKSGKIRDAYRSGAQRSSSETENRMTAAKHHAGMAKNKKDYPNPNAPGAAAKEAGRAKSMMQGAKRSAERTMDRNRKAGM